MIMRAPLCLEADGSFGSKNLYHYFVLAPFKFLHLYHILFRIFSYFIFMFCIHIIFIFIFRMFSYFLVIRFKKMTNFDS